MLRHSIVGSLLTCCVAWGVVHGQYGLSGAPELIPLPATERQAAYDAESHGGYLPSAAPSRYQNTYSPQPSASAADQGYQQAPQANSPPAATYRPSAPLGYTGVVPASPVANALPAPGAPRYAPAEAHPAFGHVSPAGRPQLPGRVIPTADTETATAEGAPEPPLLPSPGDESPDSSQMNLMDAMLGEEDTLEAPVLGNELETFGDEFAGDRSDVLFGEEPCETCGLPSCTSCDPPTRWYTSVAGLIMGRNDANRVWFSYQSNNNANQLMHSQDARASWQGGWEVTLGRFLGSGGGWDGCQPCSRWAIEATYWGAVEMEGDARVTHDQFVSTPLIFTDVVYADPGISDPVTDLFFGVYEQRLWRRNDFHSVELNLVRHSLVRNQHDLAVDWLWGVRYFRFDEELTFGSRAHDGAWYTSPTEEGYLSDRTENNLVGFQFGFAVDYHLGYNLALRCTPKIGIYNNHIRNRFQAYRGDGAVFGPNPTPPVGDPVEGSYPVISTADALAFTTQVDLGLDWQMSSQWSAFVGYRVLVATGIALADNQFPPYVVDIPEIADIDYNGELILHGGFAGLTYRF